MVDLFTYFIYITLLLTLLLLTAYRQKIASARLIFESLPKLRLQHYIALLILSIVVGLRYEVGVDWEGYKLDFETIKDSYFMVVRDQYMEPGFYYLNRSLSKVGLSYVWMFLFMALISWYFVFKSVPKPLIPILIFFLFADEYFFWSMNGVRQFAAIGIWLVATHYIINRNLIKYIILIAIASLFHRSVLLLIPFYFLPYDRLYGKSLWIILFVVSFIIGANNSFIGLIQSIIYHIGQKIEIVGVYVRYIESNKFVVAETQAGIGFIFKTLVNLFLLLISGVIIEKYPRTKVYFVLFFIGVIMFNLFYNVQLLGRINNYFLIFRSIVLAISAYHFWKIPKYRVFIGAICLLYFIIFLVSIYNSSNMCSPYRFSLN